MTIERKFDNLRTAPYFNCNCHEIRWKWNRTMREFVELEFKSRASQVIMGTYFYLRDLFRGKEPKREDYIPPYNHRIVPKP